MKINEIIKQKRTEKNISQRELGRRIGKTGQFISLIEKGTNKPSIDTLNDIAIALDCNLFDLTLDSNQLQHDAKIIESTNYIIELAKKCGITINLELDNDGNNEEYLKYAYITYSDQKFRLRGSDFYSLIERILNSITTNILAAEYYNKLI